MIKKLFITLVGFVFLISCQHEIPDSPQEEVNASELDYGVDTLKVAQGGAIDSKEPTVVSNSEPSYSIVVTPFTENISIDNNNGVISSNESLSVGVYNITIVVNNQAGSSSFEDVVVLQVVEQQKAGIETLVYVENVLSVEEGGSISSTVPVFEQDLPVSFTLTTSPSNDQMSINGLGVISVSDQSLPGVFTVSVTATNEDGVSVFNDIMNITVVADIVSFDLSVAPLISQKCAPCHTTGSQPKFIDYDVAKSNITTMISRVELSTSSRFFMPSGGESLSDEEIEILKNWQSDGLIE